MANENKSAMNASPIKSWMKVAGGSTKSAFKEYLKQSVMPVTAEMAKDLSESLKKTQAENKQERPKKQSEIFVHHLPENHGCTACKLIFSK